MHNPSGRDARPIAPLTLARKDAVIGRIRRMRFPGMTPITGAALQALVDLCDTVLMGETLTTSRPIKLRYVAARADSTEIPIRRAIQWLEANTPFLKMNRLTTGMLPMIDVTALFDAPSAATPEASEEARRGDRKRRGVGLISIPGGGADFDPTYNKTHPSPSEKSGSYSEESGGLSAATLDQEPENTCFLPATTDVQEPSGMTPTMTRQVQAAQAVMNQQTSKTRRRPPAKIDPPTILDMLTTMITAYMRRSGTPDFPSKGGARKLFDKLAAVLTEKRVNTPDRIRAYIEEVDDAWTNRMGKGRVICASTFLWPCFTDAASKNLPRLIIDEEAAERLVRAQGYKGSMHPVMHGAMRHFTEGKVPVYGPGYAIQGVMAQLVADNIDTIGWVEDPCDRH